MDGLQKTQAFFHPDRPTKHVLNWLVFFLLLNQTLLVYAAAGAAVLKSVPIQGEGSPLITPPTSDSHFTVFKWRVFFRIFPSSSLVAFLRVLAFISTEKPFFFLSRDPSDGENAALLPPTDADGCHLMALLRGIFIGSPSVRPSVGVSQTRNPPNGNSSTARHRTEKPAPVGTPNGNGNSVHRIAY